MVCYLLLFGDCCSMCAVGCLPFLVRCGWRLCAMLCMVCVVCCLMIVVCGVMRLACWLMVEVCCLECCLSCAVWWLLCASCRLFCVVLSCAVCCKVFADHRLLSVGCGSLLGVSFRFRVVCCLFVVCCRVVFSVRCCVLNCVMFVVA